MTKTYPNGVVAHYDEAGAIHADGAPATTGPDGSFAWFCHGIAHRTDGPAIFVKHEDGTEISEYWIRGKPMTITEKHPNEAVPRQV